MARKQESASVASTAPGPASTPGTAGPKTDARGRKSGHELRPATAPADTDQIADDLHKLRFGLLEGIAYHAIREQFLARLNRFLTGLQVFLGTSAIAAMTDFLPFGALAPLVISSLAGVVLLVIDPAAGAREHRSIRARLHAVRADTEEVDATMESIRSWQAQSHRVAADAPPAFRCVQAIAFNTAVNAMYEESEAAKHRYKVGFWRALAGNWIPMRGFRFRKQQE